ncbi:MAG: hypothetical protein ABIU58_05050 [Ramlibacter sp.]
MKFRMIAVLLAVTAACQAHAIGRLADVSVVDRTTGATLPTYFHRGEYWVAGAPGAKYAVAVRNRLGGRVLAVTAVDGVNVLSGETASWDQTGYVFGGGERYEITGWRKSDAQVATFEFSAATNSYAERTGRPANVGVIGVALFREKAPAPPMHWPQPPAHAPSAGAPESARAEAPAQGSDSLQKSQRGDLSASAERRAAPAAVPKLGTAHGERESSHVSHTDFERLQSRPDEVVRIRYDSRENLVALGVIPEPQPWPRVPNPFPQAPNASYVPDPPAWR